MQRLSSAVRRTQSASTIPPAASSSSKPDIPVVLLYGRHDGDASTSGNNANFRELEELVHAMRAKLDAARVETDKGDDLVREEELDAAFGLFVKIGGQCAALCRALVVDADGQRGHGRKASGQGHVRTGSSTALMSGSWARTGLESEVAAMTLRETDRPPVNAGFPRRMTATEVYRGGMNEDSAVTEGAVAEATGLAREPMNSAWVGAVREWRACLEELVSMHKLCLINTYKRHEVGATPEILDALFTNRKSRSQVVSGWMKNFGSSRRMQESGVWSKWEAQFQNYVQVVRELGEITSLLQGVDSGTTPNRVIDEHIIAPRGDAVLEFANSAMDWKPVLRFRVSSHMLAETSPIFARMFSKQSEGDAIGSSSPGRQEVDESMLPPPPTRFTCEDGSRALLYRMPQLELDNKSSLTILLHAAHMHNDRVPREVSFEQFVALAEVSLRYRCTSPLELYVEHRWLPRWVHKVTDDMPDGLVIISYAFGLRTLFTRVTKTAIINLVDEKELASKTWPAKIKERIWAVRCAKLAQVYGSCAKAIEEYLRPPPSDIPERGGGLTPDTSDSVGVSSAPNTPVGSPPRPVSSYAASITPSMTSLFSSTTTPGTQSLSPRMFTSVPRCPKGSHWCDATNLGWLMLVYNELQIISSFLNPYTLSISSTPPPRSLAQIVEALRAMASPPPHPAHKSTSVCDPAPAFRAAINDVSNSVAGLTLYEIDGTRHGWALSSHEAREPQVVLRVENSSGGGVGVKGVQTNDGAVADDGALTDLMAGLSVADSGSPRLTAVQIGVKVTPSQTFGFSPVSGEEVWKDERLCLRILQAIDRFQDLHSLAVMNRGMYAVYRKHELELRRNITYANRRSTVLRLVGEDEGEDDDFVENQKSVRHLHTLMEGNHNKLELHLNGAVADERETTGQDAELDGENESSTEAGISTPSGTSTRSSNTPTRGISPTPSASVVSCPSEQSINPFFSMTEEEARQVLWPDGLWPEPSPALSPQLSTPQVHAFGTVSHVIEDIKYGAAGNTERVENKTLVIMGNKQLREDFDRRVGLS